LAWTHFKQIIYIDDPLKRDSYAEMCCAEGWSTRTLQQKIDNMLFDFARNAGVPFEVVHSSFVGAAGSNSAPSAPLLSEHGPLFCPADEGRRITALSVGSPSLAKAAMSHERDKEIPITPSLKRSNRLY
jgi:hypothetical protein